MLKSIYGKSIYGKSFILGICFFLTVSTCFAEQLPRLVDVGADKCIPCKMMAPILEELTSEYAGRMEVLFVDIWKMPEEADKYRVKMIPTQIFYNSEGKEIFRRAGFIGKEDILNKWQELGYDFRN